MSKHLPVTDLLMWFCPLCGHSDFYKATNHRNENGYWCSGSLRQLTYRLAKEGV